MAADLIALVMEQAVPLAASLGLDVWGAECAGAGRPVVRLFVEKASAGIEDGSNASGAVSGENVSVDDCAELSRLLGVALDVEEIFSSAWTLEVSSPGLERTFFRPEQLQGYIGREIDVVLTEAHPVWPAAEGISGRKKFRGELRNVEGELFTLSVAYDTRTKDDPEQVEISWKMVRRAHLVHSFPEPGLPGKGGRVTPRVPKRGDDA